MPGARQWVFADYKQAEAMVVAWAGPVPTLKQLFKTGKDVHTYVARDIARYVQENAIVMPQGLFTGKHWSEYDKKDPERQTGKTTVHANNYGLGAEKFGLITKLPEKYAKVVQEIYHKLFPEVKSGYQAWIIEQLKRNRTITLPQGWHRVFWDIYSAELERAAFAFYAAGTVGALLNETLCLVRETFGVRQEELWTPWNIRNWGYDVKLQIHDAIGVGCEESEVEEVCQTIKRLGERPLDIKGDILTIPMDFKVGPTWGDAKDYEPAST